MATAKGIPTALYSVPADGSAPAEQLTAGDDDTWLHPASWTPDGDLVLAGPVRPGNDVRGNDIMVLSMKDRKVRPLLATPFDTAHAAVSPDGSWLAYSSNESSASGVYVRPFPAVDKGRFPVSAGGPGTAPRWRGKEILYLEGLGEGRVRVMSVEVKTAPTFAAGLPRVVGRPRC